MTPQIQIQFTVRRDRRFNMLSNVPIEGRSEDKSKYDNKHQAAQQAPFAIHTVFFDLTICLDGYTFDPIKLCSRLPGRLISGTQTVAKEATSKSS